MRGLITGGTGFLGTALRKAYDAEFIVLTRNPRHKNEISSLSEVASDQKFDFIINFAGEPIAEHRWNKHIKQEIYNSRVNTTHELVSLVKRLDHKPSVIISGSAIGYYGHSERECSEDTPPEQIFISELCQDWEQAILPVSELGIRLCVVRTGVVLDKSKGMLGKLELPFKLGLGGKIGSGQQVISWIHIEEYINIIVAMLHNPEMRGAYNATAPNPATNLQFVKSLAKVMHRPAIIPMPAFAVKMIFGEMGDSLLLHGQRVLPTRLLEQGFNFKYTDITQALRSLV